MNTVRRTLVRLAVVLALIPVTGCTFGMYRRESRDPAPSASPPCYSGDICGVALEGGDFGWTRDVMRSATGHF